MKLSIVIPVFNKWNFTKSCLTDLAQLPKDHQIIIIDNASTDGTSIEIDKLIKELAVKYPDGCEIGYVVNDTNVFHSKACNQGAKLATGERILFLNNDIRVRANHSTWTQTIIDACDSTNGLVGPTMGLLDKNLNFVKESSEQLTGNSYLGGWCIAARKDIWEKVGYWNEEFPFYFNDTDLSFRARKKQIPITVVKLTDVAHFGKVSAQQINIPKLYQEGRKVFLKHWSK